MIVVSFEQQFVVIEVKNNVFYVRTLSRRLMKATLWFLQIGFLGVGIGAAVVLRSSVIADSRIKAIACLDGLPDLVREVLPFVKVPALFMVASSDNRIMSINEYAFSILKCKKEIEIISNNSQRPSDTEKLQRVEEL